MRWRRRRRRQWTDWTNIKWLRIDADHYWYHIRITVRQGALGSLWLVRLELEMLIRSTQIGIPVYGNVLGSQPVLEQERWGDSGSQRSLTDALFDPLSDGSPTIFRSDGLSQTIFVFFSWHEMFTVAYMLCKKKRKNHQNH